MKELFALSYALLSMLVVLEAMVLREVLVRTVRIRRLFIDSMGSSERQQLPPGTLRTGSPAPEFKAQIIGTGCNIGTSDLKGHPTILLFVSPAQASSRFYEKLSAGTHALWHKADGHLYLVCSGGEQACLQIMRDHRVEGFSRGHVPMILDKDGRIAWSFQIKGTPQAVMLDEEVRVSRYGSPILRGSATDGRD